MDGVRWEGVVLGMSRKSEERGCYGSLLDCRVLLSHV